MNTQLVQGLTQVALSALGLVGTYALAKLSMYLDAKKKAVITTKGAATYNHALEVAKGFYLLLEEEFEGVEKAGADKKDKMEVELLKLFPFIPKTELDGINKVVCNQLKDKIIIPLLTEAVDVPSDKADATVEADTPTGNATITSTTETLETDEKQAITDVAGSVIKAVTTGNSVGNIIPDAEKVAENIIAPKIVKEAEKLATPLIDEVEEKIPESKVVLGIIPQDTIATEVKTAETKVEEVVQDTNAEVLAKIAALLATK